MQPVIWKDPGFWITVALIGAVIIFGAAVGVKIKQSAEYYQSELFTDVDEARKYQRECLNKYGGSATVSENATGIMITCKWRNR